MSKKLENSIQTEFMAAISVAQRYGIHIAILWAQSEESIIKRPLGSKLREDNPTIPGLDNEDFELSWIHAIPNGGSRGGTKADRQRVGAKLKAEGVRAGVADIFLPLGRKGWNGFYIEFKTTTGRQRECQKAFQEYCSKANYLYAISTSAVDALEKLRWYLG